MPRTRKPRSLPSESSLNPEISALRRLEAIFQAYGEKLDRLYLLGSALGFDSIAMRKAAEAIDTFLPMFEIAAQEEGLDL